MRSCLLPPRTITCRTGETAPLQPGNSAPGAPEWCTLPDNLASTASYYQGACHRGRQRRLRVGAQGSLSFFAASSTEPYLIGRQEQRCSFRWSRKKLLRDAHLRHKFVMNCSYLQL